VDRPGGPLSVTIVVQREELFSMSVKRKVTVPVERSAT
jgi:hypothetical protein